MQLLRPYPQFTSVIPLYSSGSSSTYQRSAGELQQALFARPAARRQLHVVENAGQRHEPPGQLQHPGKPCGYRFRYRRTASSPATSTNCPSAAAAISALRRRPPLTGSLGGWQFNGITTFQSGTPLSISATNVSRAGQPRGARQQQREVRAPRRRYPRPAEPLLRHQRIQPARRLHLRQRRNAQSTISATPSTRNHDLSLFKEFKPQEKVSVQFRAEWLNALNRVQFSGPNTSVTSTSFGVVTTQSNTPRQTQAGLKVLF